MKTEINIDDFAKLDLRVGKITKVEEIKGADKLYTWYFRKLFSFCLKNIE